MSHAVVWQILPLSADALAIASTFADDAPPDRAPRIRRLLGEAVAGGVESEYRALVALAGDGARAATPVGVVLFGLVGGTESTGMLYGIAVARQQRRHGVARALLDAAAAALRSAGAERLIAELPDDVLHQPAAAALTSAGFADAARVPDFVRDGVALRLMRLALSTAR